MEYTREEAIAKLMAELEKGKANIVITKDLSRLGRDMREASYYAEQFFPENGIRYIAIADNFDTEHENVMAPFLQGARRIEFARLLLFPDTKPRRRGIFVYNLSIAYESCVWHNEIVRSG